MDQSASVQRSPRRTPCAERVPVSANGTSDFEENTMATKDTGRRRSGWAQPSRTRAGAQPPKRLRALPGRASKQRGSRTAALNARLRPGRSTARGKAGFVATVGKAVGGLASTAPAQDPRKRRLAGLVTAGGAVAATAALKRRRRRRQGHEPPASEPAPRTTTAAATAAQRRERDGSPAGGDVTSTQTT
jgi:hypothetical protein